MLHFRSWQFCKTPPPPKSSVTKLRRQQPGNQKPNLFPLSIFFQNLKRFVGNFNVSSHAHPGNPGIYQAGRKNAVFWLAFSVAKRWSEEPKCFVHFPPPVLRLAGDGGKGLRLGSFLCALLGACFASRYCPGSGPPALPNRTRARREPAWHLARKEPASFLPTAQRNNSPGDNALAMTFQINL